MLTVDCSCSLASDSVTEVSSYTSIMEPFAVPESPVAILTIVNLTKVELW